METEETQQIVVWRNCGTSSGNSGMADGNAASPGAFFRDTNTGFFRPSSDTMGYALGGSEEFRMTSRSVSCRSRYYSIFNYNWF